MTVNLLGVLLASISSIVIGSLWYSPILFGNIWTKLSNFSPEQMAEAKSKGMAKVYFGQFVFSLICAYVLAHFITIQSVTTISGAWEIAFWIWLGFQVPVFAQSMMWEGKPKKLFIINTLHNLVSLFVMGVILILIG